MLTFIFRRTLLLILTLFFISIVTFAVIELPPGDYLTSYEAILAAGGDPVDKEELNALRRQFGLDKPLPLRYLQWLTNVLQGNFGLSFEWNKPVGELIWERLALTITISLGTLLFTWIVGFAIGVYSAVNQYSIGDYVFTTLGFIGLGLPNFLIALVILWYAFDQFDLKLSGLFSQEYQSAPWSLAKVWDMLKHLWLPLIILGTAGTAGMIRVMRANLLDELNKPYVETARSKGLAEWRLIYKYPVRIALNPFISTVGWALPNLISGSIIVSVVLSLPTTGPMLLRALLNQDMYLAASFLLILSVLTVIGTLISDILLALLDPRIRMEDQ
ncbi:ABC transporter permease [Chloroflexi bacterium TSY]|nr:ABC transporter permease [Chloroflexi bacterium TSY]